MAEWTKKSWQNFEALQQPNWPDAEAYEKSVATIAKLPPLVFAGEIRAMKKDLAAASRGDAFLLMGGDCSEDFENCTAPHIRETLKIILQMAVVLSYAGGKPVVKVGRMAGQYAKPRSADLETIDGVSLPSYRGDMVNSPAFTKESRTPDPARMVHGYHLSAATMNILRAFTKGGYGSLERVHAWNNEFVKASPMGRNYERLGKSIDRALNFMRVVGIDTNTPQFNQAQFYTSHEALLMGYEEALTRKDSITNEWYDCSAHMVWIGDRTRQLDGAHVEFLSGVKNPIGMKVGPKHDLDVICQLARKLNPENEAGRLTLITRFGKDIEQHLPGLIRMVKREGLDVVWCCDPMHGNTYTAETGHKTRNFNDILQEIQCFFEIHWAEGSVPGGVHFEMTGQNVTECTGGGRNIIAQNLAENYQTNCDPRLNAEQSLELAFQISEMIRG
ncbi:MAG: 3-deoxy-7-phosphoheptulonate synthase class II [Desulfobulbaceae bacterium]|jgi:3-deoxy-7-phosphoheptulonate synthase|nr:3-deoxy-7-phosphoheptulonate synthase class II [Desulfobulbaceae bacterium]